LLRAVAEFYNIFCTHFFNPPRYLKLGDYPDWRYSAGGCQVISISVSIDSGRHRTRQDTPNFIGNDLAFGSAAFGLDYMLEHGYSVEEVDTITGRQLAIQNGYLPDRFGEVDV
jgi:3-hydroxyacyl-CoA dehydrogenase